jgi:hypothetical protein
MTISDTSTAAVSAERIADAISDEQLSPVGEGRIHG